MDAVLFRLVCIILVCRFGFFVGFRYFRFGELGGYLHD